MKLPFAHAYTDPRTLPTGVVVVVRGDLRVMQARGRVEHDLRALHVLEGQLLRPRGPLKHAPLVLAELDPVTRRARHRYIRATLPDSFTAIPPATCGRVY
jgi:hypothetical protein